MKELVIKLTRDNFNFSEVIKYKITKDKEGIELKEFGNTHIKDNMLYIPQIEAYIDLKKI